MFHLPSGDTLGHDFLHERKRHPALILVAFLEESYCSAQC